MIWLTLQMPWPQCTFRTLTGIPCLTCGSTRAGLAFLQGDLGSAWRFNPLSTLSLAGIAIYNLYAAVVLGTRGRRLRIGFVNRSARRVFVALVIFAAILNWTYLLRVG